MAIQITNLKYSCLDIRRNAINLPNCYDFDGKIYTLCNNCPYNETNIVWKRTRDNKCKNCKNHEINDSGVIPTIIKCIYDNKYCSS